MAQSKPCVICLTPVTNYATLRCCGQPCHAGCAIACDKPYTNQRQILTCPSCQHVVPLSVLEVTPLQQWKKDPEFVQQVKDTWKDIYYLPAGRSVLRKTVPEVLSTARGRRPRAVLKTEGTVFLNTDRPRPANNIFIFFLLFFKS